LRASHDTGCRDDRTFYQLEAIDPAQITVGDLLLVESGQVIHADGIIRKGAALIDESTVTGDSTQVLRESCGRDRVMRDTMVVSGTIIVEVTPRLGHPLDWTTRRRESLRIASRAPDVKPEILARSTSPKFKSEQGDCAGK